MSQTKPLARKICSADIMGFGFGAQRGSSVALGSSNNTGRVVPGRGITSDEELAE